MKFLILTFALACANARPDVSHLHAEAAAQILKSSYDISPEGAFQYEYETSNGIAAQASGAVKTANVEYPAIEIRGSARYTSPEGEPVELSYIADENGYQPQGSHLPVPPPIPEYITRSLQYIAANQPAVQPAASSTFGRKPSFGRF